MLNTVKTVKKSLIIKSIPTLNVQYHHEGFYNCHVDLKLTTSHSLIPQSEVFSTYHRLYDVLNYVTIALFVIVILVFLYYLIRNGVTVCRNRDKLGLLWDRLMMFRGEERVVKDENVDLQGVKSGVQEISTGDERVKDEVEVEERKSGDGKDKGKKNDKDKKIKGGKEKN